MHRWIISGPRIVAEAGTIQNGSLVIEQDRIHEISASPSKHSADLRCYQFPENYYLIPGMIDMHLHGANGADVMDANADTLNTMSCAIVKEGVTGYLATTVSASMDSLESAIKNIVQHIHQEKDAIGAACLGIYLEGPFLSSKRAGALAANFFQTPQITLLRKLNELAGGLLKVMTLAPELPVIDALIQFLVEHQIIASIGHTDASFEETEKAIEQGCTQATHLFNAMTSMHHRAPGAVTALLLNDRAMVEVIADGVHLHPSILKLILKLKGVDRVLLITDAMRAKYLSDGEYELGGQTVIVKDHCARLRDGTLAGSTLKMNEAFRNIIRWTNCSIEEAVKMSAVNPAKQLGLFDQIGSIQERKKADLVVIDQDFNVVMTACQGRIEYLKQ